MVTHLGKAVRVCLCDRGEVGRGTAVVTQRSRGKDSVVVLTEHMGHPLQNFSCSILIQVPGVGVSTPLTDEETAQQC